MIARFEASSAVASLLAVPPQSSHHVVDIGEDGLITQVTPMRDLRQWENGGYFVLRPEIFDYLNEGEDLVEDAIARLVPQRRVLAYPYKGYWSPADTVKERAQLEEMYHRGNCPWMVWDPERSGANNGHDLGRRTATVVTVSRHAVIAPEGACRASRCPCSPSAHTPTTSRSAPAACCSAWPRANCEARYVVLTGTAERQQEARNAAHVVHAGRGPHHRPVRPARGSAAGGLGQREGDPRGRRAVVLARRHHRAVARRRAPGSPDHR